MPKPDFAHSRTDQEISALENRIAAEYKKAADELQDKIDAYFARFKERDAEQLKKLKNGEITTEYYKQWRLAQIGRGKRFEALRDRIAERMTNANETAAAYINDITPGIYSLNRNFSAYTIERELGADIGFNLWDERTVRRLIVEQPDLMPYYPKKRAVQRGFDLAYGKKQITAQITSGILQGESIKRLADRLQKKIPDMNRNSAIRAARTAVTGAQNAGRLDSYLQAEQMGIRLKKRWLATLDNRTRHTHAILDGQTRHSEEPFEVDGYTIMFPSDPSAAPEMVYNCRCTLISEVDGVDMSDAKRRARDPKTGEGILIENMTYSEWAGWKESTNQVAEPSKSGIIKEKVRQGGGGSVRTIGKIDIEKYRAVSPNIRTAEVVITDERIAHIKERHPNDFERYSGYISEMLSEPQYILADPVPQTAVILQEFSEENEHFRLILKLAVAESEQGKKNSVITFMKISEKKFRKYLRNKKILYKAE